MGSCCFFGVCRKGKGSVESIDKIRDGKFLGYMFGCLYNRVVVLKEESILLLEVIKYLVGMFLRIFDFFWELLCKLFLFSICWKLYVL